MNRFSIFVVAIVALVAAIAISTGHSDGNEAIASSHDATPTPTPTPTATVETVWLPLDCGHVHPNHTYERYWNVRFEHKGAHSEIAGEATGYVSELVQELCEAGVETHHWATATPTPVTEQSSRNSGSGSRSSSINSDDEKGTSSESDSDSRSSSSSSNSGSGGGQGSDSRSDTSSSTKSPPDGTGSSIISFFFGEENDDEQEGPLISAKSSHATPTPTPTLTPAQIEEWIEAVRPDPNRQCKVTGTYVVPPADNPNDTTSYGNETTYRANGWRIESYTAFAKHRTSWKPPRTRSFASGVGKRKWVSYTNCS